MRPAAASPAPLVASFRPMVYEPIAELTPGEAGAMLDERVKGTNLAWQAKGLRSTIARGAWLNRLVCPIIQLGSGFRLVL